jgi:hypothetical protein
VVFIYAVPAYRIDTVTQAMTEQIVGVLFAMVDLEYFTAKS